ncbi:MAG TPA: hypothetical protein ENN39_04620 [Desulfonatronum sp.]|nr:hypothetical protein [Desulfonatronum sp.]
MPHTDYLQIFFRSSLIIQGVYVILASMSVTCWSIVFYKLMQLRRMRKKIKEDSETFQGARELHAAFLSLAPAPDSISHKVAQAGYIEYQELGSLELPQGERVKIVLESLRHTLGDEVRQEVANSFRPLPFLGVCANAAPLMGLFGTVWGIFHSFQGFGNMGRAASLMVVGQGLGEALGTTIAGLLVAIPATLFYNYFLNRIGDLERSLTQFSQLFLKLIKNDLHRRQAASGQAR